jgi:hypothetical protein
MNRRIAKFAIGAVGAAVLVMGIWSELGTSQAASGRCLCPLIYAPVKCSNGKTYPNLCTAQCQNAKQCVPTGEI